MEMMTSISRDMETLHTQYDSDDREPELVVRRWSGTRPGKSWQHSKMARMIAEWVNERMTAMKERMRMHMWCNLYSL